MAQEREIEQQVEDKLSESDEVESRLEKALIESAKNKVSPTWTLMTFLRGMIGPGCLALPLAVSKAGSATGVFLIFFLGFLNLHGMSLLVKCAQYLCEKSGKLELDYGHLAKKAVDYGPHRFRPHSKKALYITNSVIGILQTGVCAVQFVFMASHIKEVVEHYSTGVNLDPKIYLLFLLLPVILLTFVRSIGFLAMLSTFGNVLMVVDFIIIFQAIVSMRPKIAELPAFTDLFSIILACGSILYAFEGQAMVLPLENKMSEPKAMVGWNGVLSTGMAIVTCIYAATGFFGYSAYGKHVEGSITLNLNSDNVLYNIVKLVLVLAIFVGFALQAFVVIEMLWPAIKRKLKHGLTSEYVKTEYAFRASLVTLTFLIAIAVPKLELIIPLVGVSGGMLIAFVFPPLIELITYWQPWREEGLPTYLIWLYTIKDICLISVGVFGLIIGTYSNIDNIVKHFGDAQ